MINAAFTTEDVASTGNAASSATGAESMRAVVPAA
jgi:hypothetical protein